MSDRTFRRGAGIVAGVCMLVLVVVPAVVIASRPAPATGSLEPLRRSGPTESADAAGLTVPELRASSALVSDQEPLRLGPAPTRVQIDPIDIDARIVPVGVTDGTTEVPRDVDQVGWYRYAGRPASPGSTLLLAHVSSAAQGAGAFFRLRELQVDQEIEVSLRDGSAETYRVIARRMYPKAALPDRIFDDSGESFLTLVTCGGSYSSQTGRFEENVVVYALPVG